MTKKKPGALAIKVLTPKGEGPYSHVQWPLPRHGKPGGWMRVAGKVVRCQNAIHAATVRSASFWNAYISTRRVFIIELEGRVFTDSKVRSPVSRKLWARGGRLLEEVFPCGNPKLLVKALRKVARRKAFANHKVFVG